MAVFSQSSAAVSSEVRCDCGGNHLPQDHWEFLESMPQRPTDMVDDLIKMGIYKSDVLDLASTLAQVEMREALLLRELGGGNPAREAFCRELLQEAGGLDQAMAAAFGVHATEFFSNTIRSGDYSRREFMKRVVVAASLIAIGSCAQDATKPADEKSPQGATPGKLEKPQMNIGFIPITCATPIVMSEPLGFYEKQGLKVTVKKMPNWAAVRDSAIAGELDAYHMLSPMPISIALGFGSAAFAIKLASIENINGQAITIARQPRGAEGQKSPLLNINQRAFLLFLAILFAFLGIWELGANLKLFLPIMPSASQTLTDSWFWVSNPFFDYGPNDRGIGWLLLTSIQRVLTGFLIGSAIAVPLGVLTGLSPVVSKAVDPFIQILRPVSPLAWLPLGLALMKSLEKTALFVIATSSIWPTLANTKFGVGNVDPAYLNVARTLGASSWRTIYL
jgi:NMT1-like family/Binding-protein-dependent transport system inner membrane component